MADRPSALRLTFSYKDGVLQLVSTQAVDMVVPPGDPPARGPEHGFWAELHDASGNILFRRVLHNPIPADLEVFPDEPGKTVARAPGAPSEGMFSVVVPNRQQGTALALFSSQHAPAPIPARLPAGISHLLPHHALRAVTAPTGAAREVARFDLPKP